ncbi:hypothetical protein HID58_013911 [Brassica napus]|uniref:Reticulon-like protein n=1 Tax=Brassica napus TaxID=3708 RepID=A0ABQ8DFM6_BRANA|nr:hypothetical protein HID58_013911 [Brassica napus]
MSTAAITAIFPPPPPVPIPTYITTLGLGYPIAIALGFLLLISTIILICCRASRLRFSASAVNGDSSFGNRSIIVPRIIFVAADDDLESPVSSNVVVGGLDQAIINSYPKFPYTKEDGLGAVEEAKIYRLFGREKPVHKVLCGGLPADVFLWSDKKLSTQPRRNFLLIASALRNELNKAFVILRSIACNLTHESFLIVIHILVINRFLVNNLYLFGQYSLDFYSQVVVGLWIISVVGKLVQLLDRCFVLLHTVPMMYEKHEDKVDPVAEKRMKELKKHYVVFDDKVLSKVPLASLKAKLG